MFLPKTQENTHKCMIAKDSTSCLPKLPPYANSLQRACRKWKKNLLVSEVYMKTKYHFRSTAAIFAERRRQLCYPPYIIHPFSNFIMYREVVTCVSWCVLFLIEPIAVTFGYRGRRTGAWSEILICARILAGWLLFGNVFLCFLTGYHNSQTKEIILDPKKIAYNYLKTYFLFDFVAYTPIEIFMTQESNRVLAISIARVIRHVFMYVRIPTMLEYFRHFTLFLRIGDALHEIICRILLSLFVLHWSSCVLYFIYEMYVTFNIPEKSWIRKYNLDAEDTWQSEKYTWCLYMVMMHFYRAGGGRYSVESRGDYITLSVVMVLGVVFHAYIIAIVLQAMGAANSPENKYEELLHQLHQYLHSKNMPLYINMHLRMYYEHRFQKRYFQERAILATLSEHLLHEIKLHICQHLIEKITLFKGLSKGVIGSIIGELELEVYLTNDVIIQHGVTTDFIYLLSYGTVAVVHSSGVEICHFDDGEIFGISALFHDSNDVNIIAVEICEIFRMPVVEFYKYMSVPSIANKLKNLAKARRQTVNDYLARYESEQRDRQEVLYKVREGKILEEGHSRH